jgi:hypothetical protein
MLLCTPSENIVRAVGVFGGNTAEMRRDVNQGVFFPVSYFCSLTTFVPAFG